MADRIIKATGGYPPRLYRDMGDGTFAEVVALGDGAAVEVTPPSPATFVDKSGTITLGGTAQTLAAANTARTGFFIQNNSTGDLWFNTLATAVASQPSIKIASGGSVSASSPDVPTGAISIIGATTSQAFSAREW